MISNSFRWLATTFRLLTYNKVGFVGFLGVTAIVLLSYLGPYIWPPPPALILARFLNHHRPNIGLAPMIRAKIIG